MVNPTIRASAVAAFCTLLSSPLAANEPYLPDNDSEVLETLPTEVFARRDGIARLRQRLAAEPENQDIAATVAQHYIGLGKSEGDPRFYGYARASIAPWWRSPSPSTAILRARAKLKETDHDYAGALDDLKVLLGSEPEDEQAWVEVANINRVIGDYASAGDACDQLGDASVSIPAMVARAPLLAATGQAEDAYRLLQEQSQSVGQQLSSLLPWVLTMQAEIAKSLGRTEQAEEHYAAGLREHPGNAYLKRSYADFLLDQKRPEKVLELLRDDLRDNGALLRYAIAAKRLAASDAAEQSEKLRKRFAETRLRGDLPHGRYEARFQLELLNDPQAALELAVANWSRQKELRDSRNALEAAIAADDPAAVRPVIAFLREHRTQDVVIERLLNRLEGE